jgi:hypothetical protein
MSRLQGLRAECETPRIANSTLVLRKRNTALRRRLLRMSHRKRLL